MPGMVGENRGAPEPGGSTGLPAGTRRGGELSAALCLGQSWCFSFCVPLRQPLSAPCMFVFDKGGSNPVLQVREMRLREAKKLTSSVTGAVSVRRSQDSDPGLRPRTLPPSPAPVPLTSAVPEPSSAGRSEDVPIQTLLSCRPTIRSARWSHEAPSFMVWIGIY